MDMIQRGGGDGREKSQKKGGLRRGQAATLSAWPAHACGLDTWPQRKRGFVSLQRGAHIGRLNGPSGLARYESLG
jgi:hypothetical protein